MGKRRTFCHLQHQSKLGWRYLTIQQIKMTLFDQPQLTGLSFHSISGWARVMSLSCCEAKLPNLKLKTFPKHILGSLPLQIVFLV